MAAALALFTAVYTNWEMFVGDGRPSIQGADDTGYTIWLRSAVIDGDLDFANDIAAAPTLSEAARASWLAAPKTAAGRVRDKYPPGWALAMAPGFLAGHVWAQIFGPAADGWSAPYFAGIWLWQAVLGVSGLWWTWRVARRFASPSAATIAVLALWIASPTIYYHAGRPGMVHGLVFTLLAGVFHHTFCIREGRDAWWRWAAVGFMAAVGVAARAPAALYLLFPAVALGRQLVQSPDRRWLRLAAGAIPLAAVAAMVAWAVWSVEGTLWAEPYPGEEFNWLRPRLLAVLASPLHGLFYWHPLTAVAAVALAAGIWRRELPWEWGVSVLGVWYVNAAWWNWWFGSSFGNRAFEGAMLIGMVALAWALGRLPAGRLARAAAGTVLGASVVWGAVLSILFVVQAIPREEPVTHREMISAAAKRITGGPLPGPSAGP